MYSKLAVLIILLTLLLSGCSENPFNPETMDVDIATTNYDFSTKSSVIENLVRSYEQLNVELFKQCLADSFRFELIAQDADEIGIDMDGDGIKDSWWGYQQEVRYHENLFENGSSDNTFPPPDQITLEIPVDQIEWKTDSEYEEEGYVYKDVRFSLLLQYSGGQTFNSNGYVRFYLKNEGTDEEPWWSIIIWRDSSWL
jgi:hypothetical protein